MAINGMTVGRDYSFGYYDADTQSMIDLGDVQNVSVTANKHTITSMPYNDVPRYGYIPNGYAVRGTITRTGPAVEEFQLAANTRFNAGQSTRAGYLNETIVESDGTVNRYQYTGFVIWFDDIGTITREASVKITFEGMASDKKKIS